MASGDFLLWRRFYGLKMPMGASVTTGLVVEVVMVAVVTAGVLILVVVEEVVGEVATAGFDVGSGLVVLFTVH